MSDEEKPAAPYYREQAGRNGSRNYYGPDWKPFEPPTWTLGPPGSLTRVQKPSGRPRALTTNQALAVIIAAEKLKGQYVRPGTGDVNVNKLARKISDLIFEDDANLTRDEHVRQLIRSLRLAK